MIPTRARYFRLYKSEICLHCQIWKCVTAWRYFPTHIYLWQVLYDHVISLTQLSGWELTTAPN